MWLALIAASLIRAFTGFGFALAAMPALALVVSPTEAVVLTAMLGLAVNLLTAHTFWDETPMGEVLPIILLSVPGTALGVWILGGLSTEDFQLYIGAGVLLSCLLLSFDGKTAGKPWPLVREGAGLLSGILNGAFAIPGPPIVVYVMATQSDPARSRATLLMFFMISAVVALIAFTAAGYVTGRSLGFFLLALPAALVGDRLGQALFKRFGAALYRRIALAMLLLIGIAILGRGLLA